jgi:hypothetical protein
MSAEQQRAFYGDDDRPTVAEVIATLSALTGSEMCARELETASNETEAACPKAALTPMPTEVC